MNFVWLLVRQLVTNTIPLFILYTIHNLTTGDKVNFKYTSGHNVKQVTKTAYDDCIVNGIGTPEDGPYTWPAWTEEGGTRYFVCGVPGHCRDGNMKMAVTVSNSC